MSHGYPRFTVAQDKFEADINAGNFYRTAVFSETVADDGRINIMFRTHQQGVEMNIEAEASGFSQITVTEAASAENAGTAVVPTNLNRVGAQTATGTMTHGSSFSQGSVIYSDVLGHAAPGNQPGAGAAHPALVVLAGSQDYNFSLQNLSGGAASALLALNFTDVA